MNSKFNRLLHGFSELIFPSYFKCVFCGDEIFDDNPFCTCKQCTQSLPFIKESICQCCGAPIVKTLAQYCLKCKETPRFFDQARAVFEYKDHISSVIKRYKTANARYLAETLAMYLSQKYFDLDWKVDFVVYVPLHPDAERKRDFNHASLLAQKFCNATSLKLDENLQKIKNTQKQTDLDYAGRQTNVENAFRYNGDCTGKTVLIIDDVMTTGATVNAISYELKRKGAKKVFVLTVARTVYK